jgi:hypothetical protein
MPHMITGYSADRGNRPDVQGRVNAPDMTFRRNTLRRRAQSAA